MASAHGKLPCGTLFSFRPVLDWLWLMVSCRNRLFEESGLYHFWLQIAILSPSLLFGMRIQAHIPNSLDFSLSVSLTSSFVNILKNLHLFPQVFNPATPWFSPFGPCTRLSWGSYKQGMKRRSLQPDKLLMLRRNLWLMPLKLWIFIIWMQNSIAI